MRILNSLIKILTRNSPELKRTFVTTTISSTLFPIPPVSLFTSPHFSLSRSTSPFSKWVIPFSGPLFLSSPPWKLSQSATPLYLQGDIVLWRKVKAFDFFPAANFPIRLRGIAPASPVLEFSANRVNGEVRRDDRGGSFAGDFINLPNLVSIGRLISGPFLGWVIVNEWYSSAFLGLVISGATDWLDGYLARKMNITSVVGSYLDPLADKVLIGCVAIAMVHNDLLHPGLVGLVVLRDVSLIGAAVYQRASSLRWEWKSWLDFFNLDGTNPQKVEPLFISKVNTVFQLVLVAAALLQPQFGTEDTKVFITYLSWLVASTTLASSAAYGAQQMKRKAISTKTCR